MILKNKIRITKPYIDPTCRLSGFFKENESYEVIFSVSDNIAYIDGEARLLTDALIKGYDDPTLHCEVSLIELMRYLSKAEYIEYYVCAATG